MNRHFHWHFHGTEAVAHAVFLHGFMGSGADGDAVARALGPAWRVLAPDLPGHGMAGETPDTAGFPETAAALAADLDVMGIAPCPLIGYSMGGRLALYLALTYPGRFSCLALESASPGIEDTAERAARREADTALAARLEAMSVTAFAGFLEAWHAAPLFASLAGKPALREWLAARRMNNSPARLAAALRGMGTGSQPEVWTRLGELTLPVLCLVGDEDTKYDTLAREMQSRHPAMKRVAIPGASHNVHDEAPEEYGAVLRDFLSGVRCGSL